MDNQSNKKMKYKCYAKPASQPGYSYKGKTCGHLNKIGIIHGQKKLICCEKCGCTKIASDSRRKEHEINRTTRRMA